MYITYIIYMLYIYIVYIFSDVYSLSNLYHLYNLYNLYDYMFIILSTFKFYFLTFAVNTIVTYLDHSIAESAQGYPQSQRHEGTPVARWVVSLFHAKSHETRWLKIKMD